jgi:hypothetical protein
MDAVAIVNLEGIVKVKSIDVEEMVYLERAVVQCNTCE